MTERDGGEARSTQHTKDRFRTESKKIAYQYPVVLICNLFKGLILLVMLSYAEKCSVF